MMQEISEHNPAWSKRQLEAFHRLYALRSRIAGFAAFQAAQRVAGGASAAPLGEPLGAMREAADRRDYVAFLEADLRFHREIACLAGVPPLEEMWLLLESEFREFAAWSHRTLFRDLRMIADAHEPQLAAIARGDAPAAEHAAQVDLDALWQMLTEQPATASDEPDPVERVCAYLLLNLHRKIGLAGVARDVAFVSPSHLARLFRERRRESFTSCLQGLRMRRAAMLLADTDLPVREIADRVGYDDASRFALHFRRHHGRTPSEWRECALPRSTISETA